MALLLHRGRTVGLRPPRAKARGTSFTPARALHNPSRVLRRWLGRAEVTEPEPLLGRRPCIRLHRSVRSHGHAVQPGSRAPDAPVMRGPVVEKTLARLERRPILEQIAGIELATGGTDRAHRRGSRAPERASLVRNLALHNRWEVDEQYAKQSARNRWQPGEVREFDISEGYARNRSLLRVLNALSLEVAQRFVSAPGYP